VLATGSYKLALVSANEANFYELFQRKKYMAARDSSEMWTGPSRPTISDRQTVEWKKTRRGAADGTAPARNAVRSNRMVRRTEETVGVNSDIWGPQTDAGPVRNSFQ
jgi:hypothetical protein